MPLRTLTVMTPYNTMTTAISLRFTVRKDHEINVCLNKEVFHAFIFIHSNSSAQKEYSASATALVGLSHFKDSIVLLRTTLLHIYTPNGNYVVVRAVLDSAAHQSFISELGFSHSQIRNFPNEIKVMLSTKNVFCSSIDKRTIIFKYSFY